MFKYILLIIYSLQLYSMQLQVATAREHSEFYSILHLKSSQPFVCEKESSDLTNSTEVICAFNKKPKHIFKNISNNYFIISSKIDENTFFIIVKPKYKIFIRSIPFNLTRDETVFNANINIAKQWLIVGYKNTLPLMHKKIYNGLNFPVTFSNMKLAYVGGLDLNGKPIHIRQLKNIKYYIAIKQAYSNKKYQKALNLINEAMNQYPYSIFGSLYMYDKIKILYKMKNYKKVLRSSEQFLRKYSGNSHTAEILLLTANSNQRLKNTTQAKYFYNRLLSEHAKSKYAKLGLIEIGDILLLHHKKQQAVDNYVQALDTTHNLNVASLAAYKIALFSLNNKMPTAAISYINKILKANPSFFVYNPKKAAYISEWFAKQKKYKLALKVTNIVINAIKSSNATYPLLLKNKGLWLAQTGKKREADKIYNLYIKEFPKSKYISIVKEAKYALFFNDNNLTSTQKLKHYNFLINKYKGKSIAKEALRKKVQLLYKTKQYGKILSLNLKGYNNIVNNSAKELMQELITRHSCFKAIKIYKKYKLAAGNRLSQGIYKCAIGTLSYKTAHQIASKYVSSKDIAQRIKWLYYDAVSLYHLKHYHKVLKIGDDLEVLLQNQPKSPYNKIYRVMFDTYAKQHNNEQMLSTIKDIIQRFSISFNDISRYVALVKMGTSLKDNNIVIIYGEYVYQLQNKYKTYPYSPYIEFTLAQAYINTSHINKAINILQSLNNKVLSKLQKSRQQYLLGTLFEKEWKNKEAKSAFKSSIKADSSSPWAQLSKDAIKLL